MNPFLTSHHETLERQDPTLKSFSNPAVLHLMLFEVFLFFLHSKAILDV